MTPDRLAGHAACTQLVRPPPTSRRPAGALHAHLRPDLAKLRAAPGRGAHPAQNSGAPPPRHLGPRGAFGLAAGPAGTGYGPIDASPLERQSWDRTRRSPPPRRRPPPSSPSALTLASRTPLRRSDHANARCSAASIHRHRRGVPPNFCNGQSLRPLIPTPAFVRLTSGASMPA